MNGTKQRTKKGRRNREDDSSVIELKKIQAKASVDLPKLNSPAYERRAKRGYQTAEELLVQANEQLSQAQKDRIGSKIFSTPGACLKNNSTMRIPGSRARAQHTAAEQALKKLNNLARPEDIKVARAHVDQSASGLADNRKANRGLFGESAHRRGRDPQASSRRRKCRSRNSIVVITNLDIVSVKILRTETELGLVSSGTARIFIDSFPDRRSRNNSLHFAEAEFTP